MWQVIGSAACVGVGVLLPVLCVVAILIECQSWREEREFEARLAAREPMSDEEMLSRFFEVGEVLPEVPGPVRRALADFCDYPAEKLQPDDDLGVSWAYREVDMADFFEGLEEEFGIKLVGAEEQGLPFSIRGLSHQVTKTLQRKPARMFLDF
jgi:hypothetical protein